MLRRISIENPDKFREVYSVLILTALRLEGVNITESAVKSVLVDENNLPKVKLKSIEAIFACRDLLEAINVYASADMFCLNVNIIQTFANYLLRDDAAKGCAFSNEFAASLNENNAKLSRLLKALDSEKNIAVKAKKVFDLFVNQEIFSKMNYTLGYFIFNGVLLKELGCVMLVEGNAAGEELLESMLTEFKGMEVF